MDTADDTYYDSNLEHILNKKTGEELYFDSFTSYGSSGNSALAFMGRTLNDHTPLPKDSQEFFNLFPDYVISIKEYTHILDILDVDYRSPFVDDYSRTTRDETSEAIIQYGADVNDPYFSETEMTVEEIYSRYIREGFFGIDTRTETLTRTTTVSREIFETWPTGYGIRDALIEAYKKTVAFDTWPDSIKSIANIEEHFDNAFSDFLKTEPETTFTSYPDSEFAELMFKNWGEYISSTASFSIQDSTDLITSLEQVVSEIGFTFAPDEIIKEIYDQHILDFGFFFPGRALDDWVQKSASGYLQSKGLQTSDSNDGSIIVPSVTTDQTKRVIVLNRIFNLLVLMIQILQDVAAAQAERLTFLSNWQKGYTDLISQIRTFTREDGTVIGNDTSDEGSDLRSGLNQKMMNAREKLSAWRSVVGDEAKALQSRLNQSTDAVNQQANMATAIIQQLTTILAAIYK